MFKTLMGVKYRIPATNIPESRDEGDNHELG